MKESKPLPTQHKSFRFDPQLYQSFKELTQKNGYSVTAAFNKFMALAVEFGLVFPTDRVEALEAEARIMLAWLKAGRYWVNLDGKRETSVRGRLLDLLPAIRNPELSKEIEEALKSKP
jgi:hypothetical protein